MDTATGTLTANSATMTRQPRMPICIGVNVFPPFYSPLPIRCFTDALHNPSVWMVSLAMFCFCFSCFGFVNWAAACWNADFGISLETANRYVSLFAVISLPVVVLAGFILDHVDRKRFCIL